MEIYDYLWNRNDKLLKKLFNLWMKLMRLSDISHTCIDAVDEYLKCIVCALY